MPDEEYNCVCGGGHAAGTKGAVNCAAKAWMTGTIADDALVFTDAGLGSTLIIRTTPKLSVEDAAELATYLIPHRLGVTLTIKSGGPIEGDNKAWLRVRKLAQTQDEATLAHLSHVASGMAETDEGEGYNADGFYGSGQLTRALIAVG